MLQIISKKIIYSRNNKVGQSKNRDSPEMLIFVFHVSLVDRALRLSQFLKFQPLIFDDYRVLIRLTL